MMLATTTASSVPFFFYRIIFYSVSLYYYFKKKHVSGHQIILEKSITVTSCIDNNHKCFLSIRSSY